MLYVVNPARIDFFYCLWTRPPPSIDFNDSPEATRTMTPFSPRVRAATYAAQPMPTHGLVIPSPWWWAVLGLDCGLANIGAPFDLDGPIAIIAGYVPARENRRDQEAISKILTAQGRYFNDAYTQPWDRLKAMSRIVGVCTAGGRVEDADAYGLWWDGPSAIKTSEPVLLSMPWPLEQTPGTGQQVVELTERDRLNLHSALHQRAANPMY